MEIFCASTGFGRAAGYVFSFFFGCASSFSSFFLYLSSPLNSVESYESPDL